MGLRSLESKHEHIVYTLLTLSVAPSSLKIVLVAKRQIQSSRSYGWEKRYINFYAFFLENKMVIGSAYAQIGLSLV